jgi:hypothetical protein
MMRNPIRAIASRRNIAVQHYKANVLNIFGFHLLRMWPTLRAVRKGVAQPGASPEYKEFEREGYAVFPSFLEGERFEAIQGAFDDIMKRPIDDLKAKGIRVVDKPQMRQILFDGAKDYGDREIALVQESMTHSSGVNELADSIPFVDSDQAPQIELEWFSVGPDETDDGDHNQRFHADRFVPSIKGFYFVDDHSRESGTYRYCPGTHKISNRRYLFEYLESVRYTYSYYAWKVSAILHRLIRTKVVHPADYMDLSPKWQKTLNTDSLDLEERANTMVCSNQAGFHRRGVLQPGTERKQINLTFYEAQSHPLWAPLSIDR